MNDIPKIIFQTKSFRIVRTERKEIVGAEYPTLVFEVLEDHDAVGAPVWGERIGLSKDGLELFAREIYDIMESKPKNRAEEATKKAIKEIAKAQELREDLEFVKIND